MDAIEAILTRKSIRNYTKDPVPEETIQELLRVAMQAPSSKNTQPWQFMVITDRKILNRIPLYYPYAFMTRRAPVVILVCGDKSRSIYGDYWAYDCAAATENILIAAHAKGLGAVWCGAYMSEVPQEVDFRTWLGLPENIIPFAIIAIGYPAESRPQTDRYDASRVHWNRW